MWQLDAVQVKTLLEKDRFPKNKMRDDSRVAILEEFHDLYVNWNKRNMLFNSLKFYLLFPGDIENQPLIDKKMIKGRDLGTKDIMTSWWLPVKWFLFKTHNGSRQDLTEELICRIPKSNNLEELTVSLSKIRHRDSQISLEKDVVQAMLDFLEVVYSVGNMTNAVIANRRVGTLDSWDKKIEKIREEEYYKPVYADWKTYVEDNYFQVFYEKGSDYTKVKTFWKGETINLKAASDDEWKAYFQNAKNCICDRIDFYQKDKK